MPLAGWPLGGLQNKPANKGLTAPHSPLLILHLDPHRLVLRQAFALGLRVCGCLHLKRGEIYLTKVNNRLNWFSLSADVSPRRQESRWRMEVRVGLRWMMDVRLEVG